MGFISKDFLKTQFEDFSKRISMVFARKSDLESVKKDVDDIKADPDKFIPTFTVDLSTGNLMYGIKTEQEETS